MRWAELVFHVLAHVRVNAPASAFDPRWMAFVAEHSRAEERTLAEDAVMIASAAPTHDALARVQLLAWLWRDAERAVSCSDRLLAELSDDDVDAPDILRILKNSSGAELLRAAAELEAEVVATLPPPELVPAAPMVAPWVARFEVTGIRALRLRGRVFRQEIFVGVPSVSLGPSAEHVAWQTAHEATVALLGRAAPNAGFEALEHAALVMLAEHARASRAVAAHARWLAHFANVPPLDALDEKWRAIVDALLQSASAR